MRLYHGTSSRHLARILDRGLEPRGRRKGNWKAYPSRRDMVYLTDSYAPFFAISGSKSGEKALILEVEVEVEDLYPDEDFIVQVLAMQQGRPIEEIHDEIKDSLESYRHHAKDSLEGLGNCSHRGRLPETSLTRHCLVDVARRNDLAMICMDPCISIMNYRFCGSKYMSVISWLFGDRKDFELGMGGNDFYIDMVEKCQPGYRKMVEEMFSNREGIEVVEL